MDRTKIFSEAGYICFDLNKWYKHFYYNSENSFLNKKFSKKQKEKLAEDVTYLEKYLKYVSFLHSRTNLRQNGWLKIEDYSVKNNKLINFYPKIRKAFNRIREEEFPEKNKKINALAKFHFNIVPYYGKRNSALAYLKNVYDQSYFNNKENLKFQNKVKKVYQYISDLNKKNIIYWIIGKTPDSKKITDNLFTIISKNIYGEKPITIVKKFSNNENTKSSIKKLAKRGYPLKTINKTKKWVITYSPLKSDYKELLKQKQLKRKTKKETKKQNSTKIKDTKKIPSSKINLNPNLFINCSQFTFKKRINSLFHKLENNYQNEKLQSIIYLLKTIYPKINKRKKSWLGKYKIKLTLSDNSNNPEKVITLKDLIENNF